METNHEPNDSRWMDERLSALGDDGEWRPSPSLALKRLREGCQHHRTVRRRQVWMLALAAATSASLAAFPVTRAFAGRCLSACVAETSRLFRPDQPVSKPDRENTPLQPGEMAPDFNLNDVSGDPVRLSSFRGKPVLLNFWATWCAPCKVEIPWFMEFQRTYADRGLVVLGVALDEDGWKSVKPFIDSKGINYRIMACNEEVAHRD